MILLSRILLTNPVIDRIEEKQNWIMSWKITLSFGTRRKNCLCCTRDVSGRTKLIFQQTHWHSWTIEHRKITSTHTCSAHAYTHILATCGDEWRCEKAHTISEPTESSTAATTTMSLSWYRIFFSLTSAAAACLLERKWRWTSTAHWKMKCNRS